jgi:hypothetical protein
MLQQMAQPIAHARLFLCRKPRFVIEVPENITRIELRREAPKCLIGRVQVVPETFPLRDDTIVDYIPSFVATSTVPY